MTALSRWLSLRPAARANPAQPPPIHAVRVASPRWPRLREAKETAARFQNTREGARRAWEACAAASLIPTSWVDDALRTFGASTSGWPHPPTLSGVVALAADADGAAQAEAFLEQHRAAAAPWQSGGEPTWGAEVRWWVGRTVPRGSWSGLVFRPASIATLHALEVAGAPGGAPTEGRMAEVTRAVRVARLADSMGEAPAPNALWSLLSSCLVEHARWRAACDAGLSVLGHHGPAVKGVRFADLPDPYAPLLALWSTGFLPGITSPRDGLAAPAWKVSLP